MTSEIAARRARVLGLAMWMATSGCNELIDTGRFTVGDAGPRDGGGVDGGGMDGGGRDAGPRPDSGGVDSGGVDACASRVWYLDSDDDGYGDDEVTELGCAMPAGYVARGGDCDDDDDAIAPEETETCDDIDQDCDGALDEGLMVPIGAPVVVDPDYGVRTGQGAAVVAHRDGVTVVWRSDDVPQIRATFFDRAGTTLQAGYVIEAGTQGAADEPINPRATRLQRDGLEQVYVTWLEGDGVHATVCETDGSGCSFDDVLQTIATPSEVRGLNVTQIGARMAVYWEQPDGLHLLTVDPGGLLPAGSIVLPAPDANTEWGEAAFVDGPAPYLLISRAADRNFDTVPDGGTTLDGGTGMGTYTFGTVDVVRVRTLATPTSDPVTDVFTISAGPRCAGSTRAFCGLFNSTFGGRGVVDEPGLYAVDAVVGFDTLDGGTPEFRLCAYGATPRADGLPEVGECLDLPGIFFFLVDRGTVATAAVFVSTRYAIRDLPLSPAASGGSSVPLIGIDLLLPGVSIVLSMAESHGAVIGNAETPSGFDITMQRLGCVP